MNKIFLCLGVARIVGICVLGMFAALIGLRRLDDWCAHLIEE